MPVQDTAVADHAAADPGADGDVDEMAQATAGAEPQFAQGRGVGVVLEPDRQAQPLTQQIAQRHVAPTEQGGRKQGDAALQVERAGRRDAAAGERPGFGPEFGAGVQHLPHHGLRPGGRLGAGLPLGNHRARAGHDTHPQFGAAEINRQSRRVWRHGAGVRSSACSQAIRCTMSAAPNASEPITTVSAPAE